MEQTLKKLLDGLLATGENEVIEFKQANDNFPTDKIGQYFSALANEANLRDFEKAWLVFGVDNKGGVIGSSYRLEPGRLQSLKNQIADDAEPSITFRNIHEMNHDNGRVILFEIPAAPHGMPIAWKGHYYARAGESLTSLGLDKQDEIRQQTIASDWSIQIIENATFNDLDPEAIEWVKESFAKKYNTVFPAEDIATWNTQTLLDRAKITIGGQVTRTALLLLGRAEAAHLLSPHPAQMTWKLEGQEKAYAHFSIPFVLTSSRLFQKIRNINLRLLPDNELLPYEVSKYDQKVVLEALHNCIAHQDYSRSARIVVTEWLDKLTFENEGEFFEGVPDDYVNGTKTPRRYRNPFLAQAMVELNMIDTMGYGIHQIYEAQRHRYLPMPDYDLSLGNAVHMTVYGSVVDPAYSKRLMENARLSLLDVLALDRVQKKLPITDGTIRHLRRGALIEGRKPNLYVSATVAAATANRADYIRTRAQDDTFYKQLITDYLIKFNKASRKEIDELILNKLSDVLTADQKKSKISNIISSLRKNGVIHNRGSRTAPQWELNTKSGNFKKENRVLRKK